MKCVLPHIAQFDNRDEVEVGPNSCRIRLGANAFIYGLNIGGTSTPLGPNSACDAPFIDVKVI